MMENVKHYFKKINLYGIFFFIILLLGMYLRLKGYFYNSSFWHDECALAWNIKFKSFSELFGILNFLQVAPALFLVFTKFLTMIFGYSEKVYRFIPCLSGCLSIFLFYLLSKKVFDNKITVLAALFLFAVNPVLIGYSFEFKPYGLDVFFVILILLFFMWLNLEKITLKMSLLSGLLIAFIPWMSFTSVFILGGCFLSLFIKKVKLYFAKKFLLFIPLLVSGMIYLKITVLSNYTGTAMTSDWQKFFITLNLKHFIWLFANNMSYLFAPCRYILLLTIFLVAGCMFFYKSNSKFFYMTAASLLIFLIFSFMHIYPFAERLALFLLPIFLLYIVKSLDYLSPEDKIQSFFILLIFIITFYPQLVCAKEMLISKHFTKDENPREFMSYLSNNLKNEDVIFVNKPSEPEFAYYSSFYNIKNNIIQERLEKNVSQDLYYKELDKLKKGYYWFYMPVDYVTNPVIPFVKKWSEKNNVIYRYETGEKYRAMLMYVFIDGKER